MQPPVLGSGPCVLLNVQRSETQTILSLWKHLGVQSNIVFLNIKNSPVAWQAGLQSHCAIIFLMLGGYAWCRPCRRLLDWRSNALANFSRCNGDCRVTNTRIWIWGIWIRGCQAQIQKVGMQNWKTTHMPWLWNSLCMCLPGHQRRQNLWNLDCRRC